MSIFAVRTPVPEARLLPQKLHADQNLVGRFLPHAPATRYYGSKRKLLPWIYEVISSLEFQTALDLFGGTASVSLLLKVMSKQVTYHDGLAFNSDVAHAVLSNNLALSESWIADYLKRIQPHEGVVSSNFDGIFFLSSENQWIDGFMAAQSAQTLGDQERRLLRYLLYQACLKKRPFNLFHRANLSVRTRTDIRRSFGNLTTWNKSFSEHIMASLHELKDGLFASPFVCEFLPPGNAEKVAPGYDLVYLDPPYVSHQNKRNLDNYWRKYHFLEGLATYENWPSLIDYTSHTRQIAEPIWMRDWSSKAHFRDILFATIKCHRDSIVVLSYVEDAVPHHGEIAAFFKDHFCRLDVFHHPHQYALSGKDKQEILFVGRP